MPEESYQEWLYYNHQKHMFPENASFNWALKEKKVLDPYYRSKLIALIPTYNGFMEAIDKNGLIWAVNITAKGHVTYRYNGSCLFEGNRLDPKQSRFNLWEAKL